VLCCPLWFAFAPEYDSEIAARPLGEIPDAPVSVAAYVTAKSMAAKGERHCQHLPAHEVADAFLWEEHAVAVTFVGTGGGSALSGTDLAGCLIRTQ